jgi:hypothetical protein
MHAMSIDQSTMDTLHYEFSELSRRHCIHRSLNLLNMTEHLGSIVCPQDKDSYFAALEILLVAEVFVRSYEQFKCWLSQFEKLSVGNVFPTETNDVGDMMKRQVLSQRHRHTVIEQNFHAAAREGMTRLLGTEACIATKLRTSDICFRDGPGNHSIKSSIVAPLSRLLNKAEIGTRAPLNVGTPLKRSGSTNTAGHSLQSISILFMH